VEGEGARAPKKLKRAEVGVDALEADDVLRRRSGTAVDKGAGALGRENQVGKRFRPGSSTTAGRLDRVLLVVGLLLSPVNDISTDWALGLSLEIL
jgi:hypothetical protein